MYSPQIESELNSKSEASKQALAETNLHESEQTIIPMSSVDPGSTEHVDGWKLVAAKCSTSKSYCEEPIHKTCYSDYKSLWEYAPGKKTDEAEDTLCFIRLHVAL